MVAVDRRVYDATTRLMLQRIDNYLRGHIVCNWIASVILKCMIDLFRCSTLSL